MDNYRQSAEPLVSSAILDLILKGGAGSGNFHHGGRPGQVGGSAGDDGVPSHSVDIKTKAEAGAYWQEKFVAGGQHAIGCQYGTKKYKIFVTFTRNHAYTANVTGNKGRDFDHEREFELDRARAMDAIWLVLRGPSVVTWSNSGNGNKQFDKQLDCVSARYGRVVLKPTPTTDDIAAGKVTSFEFVSWHEPDNRQYEAAKRTATANRVTPTQIKKAQSLDRAFTSRKSTNLPIAGASVGALPDHEGLPFDWTSSFEGSHHRNSCESDGFLGNASSVYDLVMFSKSLGAGEHWITVHPPGHEKGTPLLIQDHPDGTATVIGGAGGSMNHLKLRATQKGSDYKSTLSDKKRIRQEEKKKQIEADKASGVHGEKVKQRKQIASELKQGHEEFVKAVAELAGWTPEEMAFDEAKHAGLSPDALEKAKKEHQNGLVTLAKKTAGLQHQKMVLDGEFRAKAGLGELPADDPDALNVSDLAPMKEVSGAKLGFDAQYAERAGVSAEEAKAEATAALADPDAPPVDPAQQEAKTQAKAEKVELKESIGKELEDFKLKNPDVQPPKPKVLDDAKRAAAVLKALKKLKLLQRKAREANKELDEAPMVESRAHVLEVSDAEVDDATKGQMEDDVRTQGARSFLRELDKQGGEAKVAGHIGTGAFNSLNAAALAVGGDALIDRSVVDVLGVSGAAQVLARRVFTDMGKDADKVRQAIEDWHVEHSDKKQVAAVALAQEYHDAAASIELPEAASGHDLAAAQEANARRRDAIAEGQKIIGQAHGEMQAGAALVAAMQGKSPDKVEVSMGGIKPEQAIIQLRALGLQAGDYHLEVAGDNLVTTITGAGMDKLAKPIDADGMAQVRRNLGIMEGKHDEDGWLPGGMANRPDLAMHVEPGVAERLSRPFAPGDDLKQGLQDYIGGRMADGDAMQDILADIQTVDFFQQAGNPDAYRAALDAAAPLKGSDNKMKPIESLRESWEKMADDYVASKFGGARAPIHKQTFDVDQTSVDALHRALSETPEGVAAYKAVGDLTPQERNGLRNWWHANVAKEDPEAADKRQALESHIANEPEKESVDMFGDTSTNPDWHAWSSKRDELSQDAKSSSLDWPKYVDMLGSPAAAIATVQDLVRSRVAKGFADAHNTLNAKSPLKIGRTVVANNLNHLDAVDPEARKARQAKEKELIDSLRERVGGKYASGAVSDKIEAAQQKQEAFKQSQMGFFATDDLGGESDAPLAADERYTVGHAAEQKIAGMMSVVGQNFKPGQPTKLWNASMSGGKNAARQRFLKLLEANGRMVGGLGTGCVYGGTVLDDVDGRGWSFYQWWKSGKSPVVLSMNENGTFVPSQATPVFIKGISRMIRVETFGGKAITVTPDHLLFSQSRGWVRAGDVSIGELIGASQPALQSSAGVQLPSCPPSIPSRISPPTRGEPLTARAGAASFHPSMCRVWPYEQTSGLTPYQQGTSLGLFPIAHRVNGPSCLSKFEDLKCDCFGGFRPYGERPQYQVVGDKALLTSPVDAQESGRFFVNSDDRSREPTRTHFYPESFRHSMMGSVLLGMNLPDVALSRISSSSSVLFAGLRKKYEQCLSLVALGCNTLTGAMPHQSALSLSHWMVADLSLPFSFAFGSLQGSRRSAAQSLKPTIRTRTSGESPNGSPVQFDRVVSVVASGIHFVFDITVPKHANYIANSLVNHNSGKSLLQLSGFTHLHSKGKCKRGLILAPSVVQAQFGGEATRYLEPGKYKWHASPGASREERLAAYRDPDTHFVVATHQSFRDDMIHLGAKHAGIPEADMADRLQKMTDDQRSAWSKGVMDTEGFGIDYMSVDESQYTLNRDGKENSRLANVVDGFAEHMPYYSLMSADPVKNDASEIQSLMQKMDRKRYGDKAAFNRRYGGDAISAKEGLKREMARHVYTSKIDPDVEAERKTIDVPLNEHQKQALAALDKDVSEARISHMDGGVAMDVMKRLSPESFAGVPESKHAEIAKALQGNVGQAKNAAVKRILNMHPKGAKLDKASALVAERKGKPGVIFAHNLESVEQLRQRLESEGHRVVTMTGADSSEDKDKKRRMFQPEQGEPGADIMIASDAAATGLNLQRGQWMIQMDTPDTSMVHNQRSGRIFRTGQKNNVELMDLVADHPAEKKARDRLAKKAQLREMLTSPMEGQDDTGIAWHLKQRLADQQQQDGLF